MVLAAGVPLLAIVLVWLGDAQIAERHHSHHDTYVVAGTMLWVFVFAMVFMGALGVLLGWLCLVGVFTADASVVLGFFDAFLGVSFLLWLVLRRYKVMTFDDHMLVTPFVGRTATIRYGDISSMEWSPSLLLPNTRNVSVFVGRRRRALLWGGLDLDQILIRINRYDAFEFSGV